MAGAVGRTIVKTGRAADSCISDLRFSGHPCYGGAESILVRANVPSDRAIGVKRNDDIFRGRRIARRLSRKSDVVRGIDHGRKFCRVWICDSLNRPWIRDAVAK